MKVGIRSKTAGLVLVMSFLLSACSMLPENTLVITEARMVTAVNEKLMPVEIKDVFPEWTQKVSCWFQWKNAKVNTAITAKWYYITDNIDILNYAFALPRAEGSGSVALSMPDGKKLPSGSYRVDLAASKDILKSLTFKVE